MADFLLELFSEEIPARMQARAAEDLKKLVADKLAAVGLTFAAAAAFATPRRLALHVEGLPQRAPDRIDERKGPRVGAPDNVIAGFLKAVGRTSLDECEQRDTGKGVFWFASNSIAGLPTNRAIASFLPDLLESFPWPKSMRWAEHKAVWVRPLHGVLALFDGEEIVFEFDLLPGEITSGSSTFGHRFLAPQKIEVAAFADYRQKLKDAYVILDPAERRAAILAQAEALAAQAGLHLKRDEGLLDEVTGLVEWPVLLIGKIDQRFMSLPPEVLTTSMRAHQKYFALNQSDGKLAPRFIVVANMASADKGAQIVAGNERVLRARLADAEFFWDQDRKKRLEEALPALEQIVFHAKLGTVGARVRRLIGLANDLAPFVTGATKETSARATELCKADLVSGMVGEFPELQGQMGRYYALAQGESKAVADAIAEHYAPQGPGDRCPTAPNSVVLALAEKLDSLIGFFAIEETPTGSKDPFALRRAALGAIRLIVENKLRMPLKARVVAGCQLYRNQIEGFAPAFDPAELMSFFADRMKVALKEKGVRHDLIAAIFALGDEDDLVRLLARVDALGAFLKSEDGANLLTAYKRAANILRIEEKKDAKSHEGAVDSAALRQAEERALAAALASAADRVRTALVKEDFATAMAAMAALRPPVDGFFDKVTVNDPDAALRANRLRLLSQIRATLGLVADFSKIEG